MNTITLDKLPLNSCGKIVSLNCSGPIHRRLLDLGLIKGTEVESISKSPSGNLVAYLIRGAVIALRAEDASKILVERI